MNKIQRVSLFFRIVFQIIFAVMPVLLVIGWVYAPEPMRLLMGFIKVNVIPEPYATTHVFAKTGVPESAILHTLSQTEKWLGLAVSMVPMMIELFVLYSLIQLFRLYESGSIFSLRHVRYLRSIAYALLAGQILEPFYQFAMGIVLTLQNPPGHRFAAITLDQTNIGILLVSLLMILVSWIMAEGYHLREEQQLTV
ncbi:hypothetical protein AQUSIP_18270 [Aquicella siphonis]|uniref:DUF2975 domain-containing protein n=1 Tax=Aquicella siphonis TaxID=254247 RepID=A0A5E4PHX4_9COXI|nr:DUF2975 domain-containing protein [Aquicella siphonis]VVC76514.1 hypothetical protein AQUSIP_18270 [Aquicella siphonis]